MFTLMRALLGALVWLVANVVYLELKRKGIRGFTRFAAFWVGTPTTWITFFAVREGKAETFDVVDDDGEAILAEIRRDRALRPGDRPMDEEDVRTGGDSSDGEPSDGDGGPPPPDGDAPLARGGRG